MVLHHRLAKELESIESLGSLPFSSATRAGGLVFVSGQASVNPAGGIVADSFEGEMRRSIANLEAVLSKCGLGLEDIVQVRAYVGRREDVSEYNTLYREYFRQPYPARTTLTECLGPLKFEIDVVAIDRGAQLSVPAE